MPQFYLGWLAFTTGLSRTFQARLFYLTTRVSARFLITSSKLAWNQTAKEWIFLEKSLIMARATLCLERVGQKDNTVSFNFYTKVQFINLANSKGQTVPCEFIGYASNPFDVKVNGSKLTNHEELLTNFLAQVTSRIRFRLCLACGFGSWSKGTRELSRESKGSQNFPRK